MGDEAVSFWARVAMPGAGKDYGMVWMPQVDDEVLVAFEHGDPSRPFVIGGLWNGTDTSPRSAIRCSTTGKVKLSGSSPGAGHKIGVLRRLGRVRDRAHLSDDKFRISLNETKGQVHIYFDGKLLLEGTGDVEVKTQGNFKVDASGVEIKASGQTAIKGATVALN